jgi:hypothetical protein
MCSSNYKERTTILCMRNSYDSQPTLMQEYRFPYTACPIWIVFWKPEKIMPVQEPRYVKYK